MLLICFDCCVSGTDGSSPGFVVRCWWVWFFVVVGLRFWFCVFFVVVFGWGGCCCSFWVGRLLLKVVGFVGRGMLHILSSHHLSCFCEC